MYSYVRYVAVRYWKLELIELLLGLGNSGGTELCERVLCIYDTIYFQYF